MFFSSSLLLSFYIEVILDDSYLLAATILSLSRLLDYTHHWYDILAGAIIGIMFAFAGYRMQYCSVSFLFPFLFPFLFLFLFLSSSSPLPLLLLVFNFYLFYFSLKADRSSTQTTTTSFYPATPRRSLLKCTPHHQPIAGNNHSTNTLWCRQVIKMYIISYVSQVFRRKSQVYK